MTPLRFTRRPLSSSLAATAALAALAAPCLVGGVGMTALSATAAYAADCASGFPESEVSEGQSVTGLTVSHGTVPDGFEGTVIGTLTDGIAPGVDMILMRLDSDAITAAGGIWEGMSGSPVYASDGRLIGAVAYGLSSGPSPIAGITPYADMDSYLGAAPARVAMPAAMARQVAAHSTVSAHEAASGLSPLQMPLGVAGVSAHRLTQSAGKRSYLAGSAYAAGRATGASQPTADDLVPGGNLAAAVSYGDIVSAGIGTVTSVCGDRVLGFGHPMTFAGTTTLSMHPASALYIQPDSLGAPFKLANIGDPVGTITDDHLTGITGTVGPLPDTTTVTSTLAYGARSRTGTSSVTIPDADAETVFYESIANHDVVLDAARPGSETQVWSVSGTENGRPFTLHFDNAYQSDYDIAFDSSFDEADLVAELTSLRGVRITSVTDAAHLSDDTTTLQVTKVRQPVAGHLVTLSRKNPAIGRAGHTIGLWLTLTGGTTPIHRYLRVALPQGPHRDLGQIRIAAGGGGYDDYYTVTRGARTASASVSAVGRVQSQLDKTLRNNAIQASASAIDVHTGRATRVTGSPMALQYVVTRGATVPLRLR